METIRIFSQQPPSCGCNRSASDYEQVVLHHTILQSRVNAVSQQQRIQPPSCGYSDKALTASMEQLMP